MIKRIFWDIDETLIHTLITEPNQKHVKFEIDSQPYYTIIRPCSKALIEFSREIVGKDNVYILTTATKDYANIVNELAGWDFAPDHIIPRETIQNQSYSMVYGGGGTLPIEIADRNNVLIDNLPARENARKMDIIGISYDRYFKITDYYGVDYADDNFEEFVRAFLLNKHENTSTNDVSLGDGD